MNWGWGEKSELGGGGAMVRCWVWGDSSDGLPVLLSAAAGCSAADELRLPGGWVPACAGMTDGGAGMTEGETHEEALT